MKIMPTRHAMLSEALAGLMQTGVPLVSFDGHNYGPAGHHDDSGIYYSIPAIARMLDVPLDRAIDGFFLSILVSGFFVGALGLLLLFREMPTRVVALCGLALFLVAVRSSIPEVY